MYQPVKSQAKEAKRRLQQLMASLCLFALVFVGQGVLPHKVNSMKALALAEFSGDIDLETAFQNLGHALAQESFELQNLETFCKEVFGTAELGLETEAVMVLQPMVEYVPPLDFFSIEPVWENAVEVATWQKDFMWEPSENVEEEAQLETPVAEEETSMLPIGTVLLEGDSGELSAQYSNDLLYLGERDTAYPVVSTLSSEFGMRVGPLTGLMEMHRGLDMAAVSGTEIVAWSDGVVEAVGETSEVGLYIRLNHGDEVKTFYAHCSEIWVEEGQTVSVGETIALVGATGKVTGAHLHFELSWNGLYLNPALYLD